MHPFKVIVSSSSIINHTVRNNASSTHVCIYLQVWLSQSNSVHHLDAFKNNIRTAKKARGKENSTDIFYGMCDISLYCCCVAGHRGLLKTLDSCLNLQILFEVHCVLNFELPDFVKWGQDRCLKRTPCEQQSPKVRKSIATS